MPKYPTALGRFKDQIRLSVPVDGFEKRVCLFCGARNTPPVGHPTAAGQKPTLVCSGLGRLTLINHPIGPHEGKWKGVTFAS
jgi:hypothetical protein